MHVTQKEIADHLGVSRQLVTFALSGGGTVSEQKRREILEAAERMGYRRNEIARAMVTGRSRILGILTNAAMNEPMARTIGGMLEEAADRDYATKLMFVPFEADEAHAKHIMQKCSTWRLDGVLVVGLSDNHFEILRDEMARGNRPVAFAGNIAPENSLGAYSDDACAWRLAVQHLVELGHRRIAHLGARPTSKLALSRAQICLDILQEFGLPVDEQSSTFTSWADDELIEQGVHRLLDAPQSPTALLCSGDCLAMTAMRVARRRGLTVPTDLSVIGFGNNDDSRYADPALTSIAQPHEEVGRHAIRQLLTWVESELEGVEAHPQPFQLTTGHQLIVRASTAPPARI